MKTSDIVSLSAILFSFALALFLYPSLPDKMASHWGINGEVDGYMDKPLAVLFMPFLILAIYLLLKYIPNLDPLKKNYKEFATEYSNTIALLTLFLFYLYCLTLAYNAGVQFNLTQFLSPAFALLFFYIGILLGKAKQNWFVGIRTPWTLSSKVVWDKTHRICSNLFKAAGIVALLGIFMPSVGLLASVALLLATAIFSFVYSYLEYRKLPNAKQR